MWKKSFPQDFSTEAVQNSFSPVFTDATGSENIDSDENSKIPQNSFGSFHRTLQRYKIKSPLLIKKETPNNAKKKYERLFLDIKVSQGLEQVTIQKYVRTFETFDFLKLDDFNNPELMNLACNGVKSKKWKPLTLRGHLVRLSAFSSFLFFNGFASRRVQVPKHRIKPKKRDLPSLDEWTKLFDALRERFESATLGRRKTRWRDYLICRILHATGMRISECAGLKVKDLIIYDAENFWLFVDGTKSEDAERSCPIDEKLVEEIRTYLWTFRIKNRESRMFTTKTGQPLNTEQWCKDIKAFAESLQLSAPVTPHVFRHDFVFRSILAGVSPFDLIARLGHSDSKMTFYYFKQVKRLFPLAHLSVDFKTLENQIRARGEHFAKKNFQKGW